MKKLFLQSCCAPCLSGVWDKIGGEFLVTANFFNPNIEPKEEWQKRLDSFVALTSKLNIKNIIVNNYQAENQKWRKFVEKFKDEKEGGLRCQKCIRFRLEQTAKQAKKDGFDIFGTTLTISPRKNADAVNKIGRELAEKYQIEFLEANFKKQNGYLKSIELSKKYNLYRQTYCGCQYSKNQKPV